MKVWSFYYVVIFQTLDGMQLGSRDYHTPLEVCIHLFLFLKYSNGVEITREMADLLFVIFGNSTGKRTSIMFTVIARNAMDLVKIFCHGNLKAFS